MMSGSAMITHRFSFRKDRSAIAGPITVTLFILIISLIISGVYIFAIPVWVKNVEHQHMRDVTNDFINLKRNIDSQIDLGLKDVSMGTPVRMKAENPEDWFGISSATLAGTIILEGYQNTSTVVEYTEIYDANTPTDVFGVQQGYIKYISDYIEYHDIELVYVNGAIIQKDDKSGIIKAEPGFMVEDDGAGNLSLKFSSISLRGDSYTLSTENSIVLQTRLTRSLEGEFDWSVVGPKNINVTVHTEMAEIWEDYFVQKMSANKGLVSGTDYSITRTGNSVTITINNVNYMELTSAVVEVMLT